MQARRERGKQASTINMHTSVISPELKKLLIEQLHISKRDRDRDRVRDRDRDRDRDSRKMTYLQWIGP